MIERIRQALAGPVFEGDSHKTRTARLTNLMLIAILAATVLGTAALIPIKQTEIVFVLTLGAGLVAMVLGLRFLLHRGHVRATGILLSFTLWAGITVLIYAHGSVRDPSLTGYFLIIGIAAMLLGMRASVICGLLSILATLALFLAETSGVLTASPAVTTINVAYPITFTATLGLTTILTHFTVQSIREGLQRAHRYAVELEQHKRQLEKRIAERTGELQRRARHLEATAIIAREANSVLDVQELLPRAAALVNTQLGLLHTEIFLLDSTGEWAVLQAASDAQGERGQRMPARGHKVKVGDAEIVGRVAASGEPCTIISKKAPSRWRTTHNAGLAAEHESTDPHATAPPHTCTEIALPLKVKQQVIGVLDVQSTETEAFGEEDTAVLQTLADQLANAIENARLYDRAQREIAERQKTEKALRESKDLMRQVIDATPVCIFVKDQDGNFILANEETAKLYGPTPEDMVGRNERDYIEIANASEEEIQSYLKTDREVIETQQPKFIPEQPFTLPDGTTRWFQSTKMPLAIKDNPNCVLVVSADITESKQAQELLRQYAADLELRNEEIRQFTYTFTHHLRAPLVNLQGFSSELRAALAVLGSTVIAALPSLDERQRQRVTALLENDVPEALGFIDSSVTRIAHLINAMLKLSRLGRRAIRLESVDVDAVVRAVLQRLASQIEMCDVKISIGPLPNVVADRSAMEQIMSSLLENAIAYLDGKRPGEIEIAAESTPDSTTFSVRDNGRGIAEEDMDKVFAPFRRAGKQDVPGEALGLPCAQTLIHRHGGRIWCESEPEVGTTFVFTIPNCHAEEPAEILRTAPSGA